LQGAIRVILHVVRVKNFYIATQKDGSIEAEREKAILSTLQGKRNLSIKEKGISSRARTKNLNTTGRELTQKSTPPPNG